MGNYGARIRKAKQNEKTAKEKKVRRNTPERDGVEEKLLFPSVCVAGQ